jgi:uncharacterized protein YjbI with pentapeptide repeats
VCVSSALAPQLPLTRTAASMLSANNRVRCEDKKFDSDEAGAAFQNHLFVRVGAKEKIFANIDFKYSIFDGCYLRGCKFLHCDFTGCRFLSTSFHGATFSNCNFAYATFERTLIRILCTRGHGADVSDADSKAAISEFGAICEWMNMLWAKAREHERIQQQSRRAKDDSQSS